LDDLGRARDPIKDRERSATTPATLVIEVPEEMENVEGRFAVEGNRAAGEDERAYVS
jgi:hypothetical protein